MKYASAHRVLEKDDYGYIDRSNYLIINSAGHYEFDESYGATYRRKGRKDYYLSYNYSGEMNVNLKNMLQKIGSGQAFLYAPNEVQYYGQADNENISNYWVHFTGYGVHEVLSSLKLNEQSLFNVGIHDEIVDIFLQIIEELTEKKSNFEMLASALLMQLLTIIARITATDELSMNLVNHQLSQSLHHIHKYYAEKITISDVARMENFSVGRYSALFKQIIGCSPQQYIVNLRLEKAMELMRHTNLNIRQIASLVGFTDQLYFSRLFRKHKGFSPKGYINSLNV